VGSNPTPSIKGKWKMTLEELYTELAELESIDWQENYDPLHPFNHQREMKRQTRMTRLRAEIDAWENEK
jgi:hypothetical protein